MKRFVTFITVLVVFTSLFLACSSGVDSNDGNETESNETESDETESKTSIVTISYDEESSQDNDNLVFIFSFENFNVLPDKVDVYIENSEKAYKSGISVQNGKITFPKPNVYSKTFYVKANNVESNHIDIDFIYRIDVDSLSVFMNSVPDNKIVKLQVTGKYNSFMTNMDLFKNENKKIDLDLTRLEKPLTNLYGFSKCISLKKITLPYEVTSISNGAFECCSNLESVVLPEGLTSINKFAFRSCISLTDIELPSSLTTIGEFAFLDCQYLDSICIPDNVTKIGQSIFAGCSYLSNVKLPETLTSIGFGWFQDCINLETIEIPESVTSIGQCSFRGCSKLSTVIIPENVTSIVVRAFEDCENLNSVVFQVTHNWKVGIIELEEKELQDSANAAILLRETYKEFSWTRM